MKFWIANTSKNYVQKNFNSQKHPFLFRKVGTHHPWCRAAFWCTEAVFQRLKCEKSCLWIFRGICDRPKLIRWCSAIATTGHAGVIEVILIQSDSATEDLGKLFWIWLMIYQPSIAGSRYGPHTDQHIYTIMLRKRRFANGLKKELNAQKY